MLSVLVMIDEMMRAWIDFLSNVLEDMKIG